MHLDRTPSLTSPSGRALQVYLLGSVEFEDALAFQRLLAFQTGGEADSSTLILCEHPPLITVGREGSSDNILFEPEELETRGWPVRWVNRGGGCLLHVPGQLAIYPILALKELNLGVTAYLEKLQRALIALLRDFSITCEVKPSLAGLWVGNRMIASLGVAVRNWVAYFGAVLNVNPNLGHFRHIRTGGSEAAPMTSLERERRGPLRPSLVRERFIDHFVAEFDFARTSLLFHHSFLQKKAPSNAIPVKS